MYSKLYLELKLTDEHGTVHGVVRRPLSEKAAFKGQRHAEQFHNPAPIGGPTFDDAVEVLQVREFRRKLLIEAATGSGMQLADFLEDREGWHGLDRQESTEKIARETF